MNASVEQDGVSVMRAEEISGAIAFEDVAFQYGPDLPFVLKNVTLTVEPGYQVAIVGRTGSGKSTLARLIGGLYPPTSGKVLYDSHDLQTLDLNSVRIQLGIVTQEAQLFGGSIRRNIALGDLSMGLDRIIQAAKLACIHEEIMAMPMGYDTVLTDRGRSLSGGQRQRLAIARALVRDPRILILDEATNHLDKLTEERVIRNLAKVHCTKIIITHQLHTVRDFDLIVVVDGNTVIEHGSHQDLLKSGTVYAKMIGGPKQDSMAVRSTS
jgi:ABC-type bacteriocin/lantibiotic exporter with double-glycine peptidase domain